MDSRPKIFISTVSSEFASAREKVAETLRRLRFEPVHQKEFPAHTGVLRIMLEEELAPCLAIIQIVGQRYGSELTDPAHPGEVMSYTQYEAHFAHRENRKIWYFIADESYLPDQPFDEDPEKKLLQQAYRLRIRKANHLRHPVADVKDIEITVFRMFDDLDALRPESHRCVPLLDGATPSQAPATAAAPSKDELEQMMRELLAELVPALQQVRLSFPEKEAQKEAELYARLASVLETSPDEARFEIESLARRIKGNRSESLLDRAKAASALKNYVESENLALRAAEQAAASYPRNVEAQVEALMQAGEAAQEQIQYERSLAHYRFAESIMDRNETPVQWASIQHRIAFALDDLGHYSEAVTVLHDVVAIREKHLGPEHPDTLKSRNNLATALQSQGKYAEAEQEHRAVLDTRKRTLGSEHLRTLMSRNNLAAVLQEHGKYAEAEQEYRSVMEICSKVLGPEHQDTLMSRNNLAAVFQEKGEYAKAEKEHLAVWEITRRVLGPDHPDTLRSRNNFANALQAQGKHSEAEKEHRAVLEIRERILGAEHPKTLDSRHNLARALSGQNKHIEAESELRAVFQTRERVLGPENPDTLRSRNDLATCLGSQGKHSEEEQDYRSVLEIRMRTLGADHPEIFQSCYDLALCLRAQTRIPESLVFAQKAYEGWQWIFGPDHPSSKDAQQLQAQLESELAP